VGLPFLHSFASMLVVGAGRDGGRVAKHILSHRSNGRRGERHGSRTRASAGEEIAA